MDYYFTMTSEEYGTEEFGPYENEAEAYAAIKRVAKKSRRMEDRVQREFSEPFEKEDDERKANQPVNAESSDDDIRDRARELHEVDGEVEIDIDAEVSQNVEMTAEGAYVAAWVWVPFEEDEEK